MSESTVKFIIKTDYISMLKEMRESFIEKTGTKNIELYKKTYDFNYILNARKLNEINITINIFNIFINTIKSISVEELITRKYINIGQIKELEINGVFDNYQINHLHQFYHCIINALYLLYKYYHYTIIFDYNDKLYYNIQQIEARINEMGIEEGNLPIDTYFVLYSKKPDCRNLMFLYNKKK